MILGKPVAILREPSLSWREWLRHPIMTYRRRRSWLKLQVEYCEAERYMALPLSRCACANSRIFGNSPLMNFWLRLLFPKTAQLADAQAEIAHQREINAKLVDAVCRGRGEQNVFAPTEPEPSVIRRAVGPDSELDDWKTNASMLEDERLVREAVASEEGYERLWLMKEEGVPGAAALLDEADDRYAELQVRYTATEEQEAVQ